MAMLYTNELMSALYQNFFSFYLLVESHPGLYKYWPINATQK
jgi:hypothetical protein